MANPNLHKDEMDRVYKVEGGSGGGGVHYVECHSNGQLQNIQCELSPEQIAELVKSGENVVLSIFWHNPDIPTCVPIVGIKFEDDVSMVIFGTFTLEVGDSTDTLCYMGVYISITTDGAMMMGDIIRYSLTKEPGEAPG